MFWLVKLTVCVDLFLFALFRLAAILFSEALKLSFCPSRSLTYQEASQCEEIFPFSQLPLKDTYPIQIPFFSIFSFVPYNYVEIFLPCSSGSLRSSARFW